MRQRPRSNNPARNYRFIVAGAVDPGNPASISEAELARWVESGLVTYLGHVEDMPSLLNQVDLGCPPEL